MFTITPNKGILKNNQDFDTLKITFHPITTETYEYVISVYIDDDMSLVY